MPEASDPLAGEHVPLGDAARAANRTDVKTFRAMCTAAAVSLLLTACSGPQGSPQAGQDAQSLEASGEGTKGRGGKAEVDGKNQKRAERKGVSTGGSGKGTDDGRSGQDDGSGGTTSQRSGAGVSRMVDDLNDAESSGNVPAWADITGVELRDQPRHLRLTIQLAQPIPSSMPERETFATLGMRLQFPSGGDAYVSAEADSTGWRASYGRGEGSRRLDSFTIQGHEAVWMVPWSRVGKAKHFQWSSHLSWTHTTLTRVSYVFDSSPDSGVARHRRR